MTQGQINLPGYGRRLNPKTNTMKQTPQETQERAVNVILAGAIYYLLLPIFLLLALAGPK